MTAALPEPMTPPDCDLRGLAFMPLDVVRLCDSDLVALSTGEEFKAAVLLWAKAWLQVPAASLPDDPRILAHLSGAGSRWSKISAVALRGWAKCSDGRLYHPVIAEKAREAWSYRLLQRERSIRANEKRWGSRKDAPRSPREMPEASLAHAGRDAAGDAHGDPHGDTRGNARRDPKGQGQGKEPSLRSGGAERAAGPAVPAPDARTTLFREGLDRLRRLTGKSRDGAASLLGRLLRDCGDDCAALTLILAEAEDAQPASPEAWIVGAIKARCGGGTKGSPAGAPKSKLGWMMQPGAFERMAAE
jgi:hypothetical protein